MKEGTQEKKLGEAHSFIDDSSRFMFSSLHFMELPTLTRNTKSLMKPLEWMNKHTFKQFALTEGMPWIEGGSYSAGEPNHTVQCRYRATVCEALHMCIDGS